MKHKSVYKNILSIFSMLFFLIVSTTGTLAQTYREQFDKLDQELYQDDLLNQSNFGETMHNITQYLMRSYVLMYRTTSDLKYLDKFIIASKRVMDRRDDNWGNIKSEVSGLPYTKGVCTIDVSSAHSYIPDPSSKSWGRVAEFPCTLERPYMETGTITAGMAEFILLIQEHPELDNQPLPLEALSSSGTNSYPSGASISTYKEYSNWLADKVYESLDFQIAINWDAPSQYFGGTGTNGINQQAAIGRTLLLMYRVSINDIDIPDRPFYKSIGQKIATHLMEVILCPCNGPYPISLTGEQCAAWCHEPACGDALWEDASHSYLDIEMVEEMIAEDLPASNGIKFDPLLMRVFANGVLWRMCALPKTMTFNVYGHDSDCYRCTGSMDENNFYFTGGFVFLSKYNHGVYQAISDIYSPNQVIAGSINNIFSTNNSEGRDGKIMFGLSQLAFYENIFNPLTVKSSSTSTSYTGSTSGDFDGNGIQEFASLNTLAGNNTLQAYKISSNNIIDSDYNSSMSGTLKYLSAGDINIGNIGDELATIDVQNNLLILLKKQSSSFVILTQTGIPTYTYNDIGVGEFSSLYPGKEIIINSSNSSGIQTFNIYGYDAALNLLINIPTGNTIGGGISKFTIGDFNDDGLDEIAVIDNTSKIISTYSFITGNLFQLNAQSNPISISSSSDGISAGDFDGDGTDEIVFYKETNALDGAFQIYRQDGANLILKGEEIFQINQLNGVMCKLRLENYPLSEALVTLRNYDGQISIFNMDGLCPGLNLNNQPIDNSTTLSNNYGVDYHVNNTLIAGNNYIINSGTNVTFTAGNKIMLLPGFTAENGSNFQAYIEPTLECIPSTFRKGNPNNNNQNSSYNSITSKIENVENQNIELSPNPNNGLFMIAVTKNKQPIAIKDIKVYDMFGRVVWSSNGSSDNIFHIDISNYSQGIYYIRSTNIDGDIDVKRVIKQ